MRSANKLLVTNAGALKAKYAKKYSKAEDAIQGLIKADATRGLTTKLIALDDAAEMKRLGAKPIVDPNSGQETKKAIDGVWHAHNADYLAILGAPDIVMHQNLANPVYAPDDDDDLYVPSDLPYACDAPYSQTISDFRGPTRVVGRIPDLYALGDASYFVKVLRTASTYRHRPRCELNELLRPLDSIVAGLHEAQPREYLWRK